MEITVQISEFEIIREVAGNVKEQVSERIDEAVRGAIKAALEEQIEALVVENLRPVVAEIIAEGWPRTDGYGIAVGVRVGLKERINEQLQKHDTYGSREPWVTKYVREAIETELRGDLGKELKAAKEMIRGTVTGVVQQKLNETLADALGLRVK
jgi:hypothetical protein